MYIFISENNLSSNENVNDIGLIKLEKDVEFKPGEIMPINLPLSSDELVTFQSLFPLLLSLLPVLLIQAHFHLDFICGFGPDKLGLDLSD